MRWMSYAAIMEAKGLFRGFADNMRLVSLYCSLVRDERRCHVSLHCPYLASDLVLSSIVARGISILYSGARRGSSLLDTQEVSTKKKERRSDCIREKEERIGTGDWQTH
jgi:hypothetical protein